ncbi:MAG: ABC transporter permease [Anaerolineae bacterium]|jgi:ABC-type dipeptide/oligopeptide/nickel transport system permease component
MTRYAAQRLLVTIPTILAVTLLVFLMLQLVPGDPAEIFLGEKQSSPELLEQVRHDMGLDRPLYEQYLSYMADLVRGDLGVSLFNNQPVTQQILDALPYTLELALTALLISTVLGVTLGVVSALKHNTWVDSLSMGFALVGVSMPVFWFGLMLIFFFSVRLQWFPPMGQGGLDRLVLPALALGLLSSATLARLVRSSMLEVMNEDYIRTARAKGLRERSLIIRHALRNALIPAITVLGLQFGGLLSGAVLTETIFARVGLGRMYVESILNKDITMVQGLTLIIAIAIMVTNILVDLSYARLDPRIRYE